jgi:hypothetical protein
MRNICITILSLILLESCSEDNLLKIDPSYPTTINSKSEKDITQLISEYRSKNQYVVTSLDDFGFCSHNDSGFEIANPPLSDVLSQKDAIDIVKNFVLQNRIYTGIDLFDNVEFYEVKSRSVNPNGSAFWSFQTTNQYIDTVEVLKTKIIFMIQNSEMFWCVGNWYPSIYFPPKFNFNQEKAKALLFNNVVYYHDFSGEQKRTITQWNLDNSNVRLIVNPIKKGNIIELRVAWEVYMSDIHFQFHIDVMSGDIIEKAYLLYH